MNETTGPVPEPSEEKNDGFESDIGYVDETALHAPGETITKQEQDIALVAELLEAGRLSERQIVAVMSDWSIHGNVSLAKHIESRGLLTAEQLKPLEDRARTRVEHSHRSAAYDSHVPAAGQSLFLATLERLDRSGRVAKLLGVTAVASGGDEDCRESDARYQIIRKLGQGGLGRVWLARDLNLNRHVALKEISNPSQASESIIERFKHEAEITGRLEHPGIVPVYHLGKDENGSAFYAMRFLGKKTLQDSITEYHERIEEGDDDPMDLRHLLTAFVNICHALGHAHSRNVIHRDLKPENVVIDSFGQVIVIDWGLAKVLDDTTVEMRTGSNSGGNGSRTVEGQVLGTALYMAPEQAAGRLDEVDFRTDIYGLGSILFTTVTGSAPHEKTQKKSASSGTGLRGMIAEIASGNTPMARDINPDVDPALEAICAKSMARRRYARYQDATELAEDIQRWMAGESVTAYQETWFQRARRWISRNQGLTQALVAMFMVGLVALTTFGMSARQNYLDAQQSRFTDMEADVREIELQLHSLTNELSKDARFVSGLPPVQGVIKARAGIEGDDEEVWRGRLESIYSGLLRSNPNYLAFSFVAIKQMENGESGTEEIVRVERNPADPSFVSALPTGRLHTAETDVLMETVKHLEPGDVKMTLDQRPRFAEGTERVQRLSVATPLYSDISGECFGMALIEADISRQVEDVLLGLGGVECEVYVSDGEGKLWGTASRRQGVQKAAAGQAVPGMPKELVDQMGKPGTPFEIRKDYKHIGKRFYVDPEGKGVMIFARLPDAE